MLDLDVLSAELLALELALARRDRAALPGGLESLLHEEFEEFGAGGRRWDRPAAVAALADAPATDASIADFALARNAEDAVLTTYSTRWCVAGECVSH